MLDPTGVCQHHQYFLMFQSQKSFWMSESEAFWQFIPLWMHICVLILLWNQIRRVLAMEDFYHEYCDNNDVELLTKRWMSDEVPLQMQVKTYTPNHGGKGDCKILGKHYDLSRRVATVQFIPRAEGEQMMKLSIIFAATAFSDDATQPEREAQIDSS